MNWVKVVGLFTVTYANKYPYYECEPLSELAKKLEIQTFENMSLKEPGTLELIKKLEPDLIVVGSYYDIIPSEIISIPNKGIVNIHPSLLPYYKGPTPTYWVIVNNEKYTGITVHYIDNQDIDSGPIIYQERFQVPPLCTDGELRKEISERTGDIIEKALLIIRTEEPQSIKRQNYSNGSYYSRNKENLIDLNDNFDYIQRRVRALTPYPGPIIEVDNKKYWVKQVEKASGFSEVTPGWEQETYYISKVGDCFARFILERITS